MGEKIKLPEGETCNSEDMLELLEKGAKNNEEQKLVVLFDSNREKQLVSSAVGEALKNSPTFVIDHTKALTIQNNMLRSNNTKIILGLKMDEHLLLSSYSRDQIRYYKKKE